MVVLEASLGYMRPCLKKLTAKLRKFDLELDSEKQKTQVGETGLSLRAGQGLPVFIVSVRPAMHQTLTMVLLSSIAVNGSAAFLLK